MILYRKEPIPLQMRNIMLLDDESTGGVVYVNKTTYDQALLLHGRFDGDTKRIINTIKGKGTDIYDTIIGLSGLIDYACKNMPAPLNALAPFLMFAAQNKNIEWKSDDLEMAYGILHQYSQLIDFNAMTLVPSEVRSTISIPTAILMQYKASWDDLCSTLNDKVVHLSGAGNTKNVEVKDTPKYETSKKEEPVKKVEESDDNDDGDDGIDWDALNAKLEAIKNEPPKYVAPATPVKQAEPVVSKTEAKASSDVLDEFDC